MESSQSSPEDTKQATFSLAQLTRHLTKQLEELKKDKSNSNSSSSSMDPHRPVTTNSSKKFIDEFDIALSPPSQSTTPSSTCDTNSTKTDSLPSTSNPLSPREWHSSCSSPPSVKSDVRSAHELIENLTALFACTREVKKNDVNLIQAHSSESKRARSSLLQQPGDNESENDHITKNVLQSSEIVELPQTLPANAKEHTELVSIEGTADCNTSTVQSFQSSHSQSTGTKNSPTSKNNSNSEQSSPPSVMFSEIIQDNDVDLAIEVDCSESHYLNLHDDGSDHMFIFQTGTMTDSPNEGMVVQDTTSKEEVGQACSNQSSYDEPTSEPGTQVVTEVTPVASNLEKRTSCTSDVREEQSGSSTMSSKTSGRVLRKSYQRRARKFFSPSEQSDSERTLSASDNEEREWVMDGGHPIPRKRQGKGRRGSKSDSLVKKIGRKSTKARQLVVKSKAVSLRKKQRENASDQLLIRGKSRKGHGSSNESSDSSDGMRRPLKGRRATTRRSNTSQLKTIDEDYLPTPSKKRKTTTTSRSQSSLKHHAPSMGNILADILIDVPEVTIPIPSTNTNNSESSATKTPSNERKHARPLSLTVDHLPPQKRPNTEHTKSLNDNMLPESPRERIEESPISRNQFKGDIPPTTKPSYLGKVNLRLTSDRRSRLHSSNESTPLTSPEFGLQNKSLSMHREKRPRSGVKRTSGSSKKSSDLKIKSKTKTPSDDFSKHYRILMTYEKDYARGKNATKAPVLYAVEWMKDQIEATTKGGWLEKSKLIWNQWRHRVSTEERQLYSERAKKNRKKLSAASSNKTPSEPKMCEGEIPSKKSQVHQTSHEDTSMCTGNKRTSEKSLQSAAKAKPNKESNPHEHSAKPSTSSPRSTASAESSSHKTTLHTVCAGAGTNVSYPITGRSETPVHSTTSFSQTVKQQPTPPIVPSSSLEKQPIQLPQYNSPQPLSNLQQNMVSSTGTVMNKPSSLTVSVPLLVTASGVLDISKASPVVVPLNNHKPIEPSNMTPGPSVVTQSSPTACNRVSESEADMKNRLSMLAYSLNSCVAGNPTTLQGLKQPTSQIDKKISPVALVAKSPSPQRGLEQKIDEFSLPITNFLSGMQSTSAFVNSALGSIGLQPVSPIASTSFKFTSTSTAVSLVSSGSTQSITSQNAGYSPHVSVPSIQSSTGFKSVATQSVNLCTQSTAEKEKRIVAKQHASKRFRPMKQAETTVSKPMLPAWNVNNTSKSTTTNSSTQPPQYTPRMQTTNSNPNTQKKGKGKMTKSSSKHSSKPKRRSNKQGLSSFLERIPAGASSYVIPEIPLSDVSASKNSSSLPPLSMSQQNNHQIQQQPNTHNSMQDQTKKFNPFMLFIGDQSVVTPSPSPIGAHLFEPNKKIFFPKSFYEAPTQTTRTATTLSNPHSDFPATQSSFKLPTTRKKSPQKQIVSQSIASTALPSMWPTSTTGSKSSSTLFSSVAMHHPGDLPPLGTGKTLTSSTGLYQQNSTMDFSQVTTPPFSQIPPVSTLSFSSRQWNPCTSVFNVSQVQPTTPQTQSSSELLDSSNNIQPKQTISKSDPKRRVSLPAKLQPSTKKSEKHHRLDVLKKVQQLNRERQQSSQKRQSRSSSVGDENTKSNGGSLLATTISNMPTISSIGSVPNSSSSEPSQSVAQPVITPMTQHNLASFWQPTSMEMMRQPNQDSFARRLSSDRIPHINSQSPPKERPNQSRLPSQSNTISGTFSPSSTVKVEQTSPVALVVGPPEQCSTNSMSTTTPLLASGTPSTENIQPKSETEDSSMLQPIFNPSFNVGDISTMSRWEIEQLYNHHKVHYEREKRILKILKEKLIKMKKGERSVIAQKLSPEELYNRFLGFIVQPECPPCVDSGFDRFFDFKSEAANNNVSPQDVLLGGSFDHPIINPKYDFYASFTKI